MNNATIPCTGNSLFDSVGGSDKLMVDLRFFIPVKNFNNRQRIKNQKIQRLLIVIALSFYFFVGVL